MADEELLDQIPDGLKLKHTLRGHASTIHRISWSPVEDILVSPSFDRSTRFWKDGKRLHILKDSVGRFTAAAWSPDGQKLALASDNDMLRLWNTEKGESDRTRSGGLGHITCVGWDPDGRHVATGALNGSLRLWDPEFKNFKPLIKKSNDKVYCLAFCVFRPQLAIGLESGLIRIWDMIEQTELPCIEAHKGPVYSIAFSKTDGMLISSGADGTIRLFDDEIRKENILKGHQAAVTSISISADNSILASKSHDQTVRLWSLEIFEELAKLPEACGTSWLPGIDFHPKKPLLATLGEQDKIIHIWEIDLVKLTGG